MRFCREENQDYALITYCCLCCNQRWASNCCKAHRTFGASVLLLRSLQKFLHLVKKWKTLKKNLILFELQKCTHFSILSKDIHLAHTWNSVLWMLKVYKHDLQHCFCEFFEKSRKQLHETDQQCVAAEHCSGFK